jgi:hypothetical protein
MRPHRSGPLSAIMWPAFRKFDARLFRRNPSVQTSFGAWKMLSSFLFTALTTVEIF